MRRRFVANGEVDVVGSVKNLCQSCAHTEIMQVCICFMHPDTGTTPPNPFSIIATQKGSIAMKAVAALH